MKQLDFSVIIPRMRQAVKEYMDRKAAKGKELTEREATVRWLDKYYDGWLATQMDLPEVVVPQPDTRTAVEKRRHVRVPMEISAYYRVLWSPRAAIGETSTETEMASVQNISVGGLYIVTGRSYPISTLMEIQFELPGVIDSILAFSMVVWREERSAGRYGHGLHFSHIESRDVDLINEALMERLLDAPVVKLNSER